MGVLLAIVLGTLSVGENFRLYNIVPCLPGEETEAAARAVDLQRRTGVDHALYSLTLHPTGKPAMAKVERYVESFRRFRQALEGTKVRPAVLVQAILGHWPRVDRDIEPWTRTVDSTGSEVRFCPLDPGFAAYITEVFTRLAKEHPAFILTDDDVRAYSHNAECFCDTHVRIFNERRGTSYTADALRAALKAAKPDDPDYVAFLALQREMIERHVIGRARAAIDAVDPSIPGGICVAGEEHFLCAPLARGMAAKGQVPVMRISSGCYNERAGASRVPGNVCRTLGFAEYYRDSGIDLLGEADTCPHNLWSKSALSFFSHLVNAAFAGLKGAKTWYVGGRKPNASRPISPKYTEILERHRGYLDALAADVAGSEPTGLAVPCFTNFPGWHLMTNHDQFFVEPSNAGAEVCVPFGIPFRASKEFGRGVFALYSAAEANRLTDAELERLFSGKVLVFREAALALTARGRGDLLGVDATKEKLVFNAERDALTGDTMGRSPIRGEDVRLTPRGEAEVLTTLGFGELGKYEPVTPSAVLFRNRLGGTAVTVSYSAQLFYLTVFSESRKAWLTAILDRLNGERTAFAAGHDQDVLVWTRTKPDGTVLVMAENVNTEPIDRLSLRLPEGTWRAELLADDGSWQAVQGTRRGEFTDFPVPIAYYATAVLRFTPETGRTAAEDSAPYRLADLRVRDPFIVNVGGECPYLLYMSDSWLDGTAGVSVSRSRDLVSWTKPQNVMRAPGWCGYVWAPEIHRWKDAWYMFVTLKEKRELHRPIKTMVPGEPDWEHGPGAATNSTCHAVWVYRSENPMGPFRPVSDDAIVDREWVSLDGTLAVEDGKPWMVFTHDWAQVKVGTYELAPMSDDLTRFLAPPRTLFTAAAFDMEKDRGVTDGAFVYRSPKSGKLFMIWSTHNPARPHGRDYCVVLTESASGRLAGPWTNHRLLFDDNGGHGMIFRKTDGELALCLHCPEEWGFEHPRILPLEDTGDTLRIRDANEKTN